MCIRDRFITYRLWIFFLLYSFLCICILSFEPAGEWIMQQRPKQYHTETDILRYFSECIILWYNIWMVLRVILVLIFEYLVCNRGSIYTRENINFILLKIKRGPGGCSSVDWVPACKPKGHQFDSQSGHMPGLLARSPAGDMWEVTDWSMSHTLMFLSLSFSLPSPLSPSQ